MFPPDWGLPWQISECKLDDATRLVWRDRLWIPFYEPLRTRLIQEIHDSTIAGGHPGHSGTRDLLSRFYAWPGMSDNVRRFVGNCDTCGKGKLWREQKRGLLKPLPVPDRRWQELAMDFIGELPDSDGNRFILTIIDRLSKEPIFVPLSSTVTMDVAQAMIVHVFQHHGLPRAITSDRGPQFISLFWKEVCRQLSITRRLSTAYHPETDGASERCNQEVETYLRAFCTYNQENWSQLLPQAKMALSNKTSASTGISPFFFGHGFHMNAIDELTSDDKLGSTKSPATKAREWLDKHRDANAFAQASMALAQETQERHANRGRQTAESLRIGDKVYLRLKNIHTTRPSKKLDWIALPYHVKKLIGTHAVKLDTPPGIHPVFHVSLLRRARNDPLPSQKVIDSEPGEIQPDDADEDHVEGEYLVESIVGHRRRRGAHQVHVKWTGWAQPTWEPLEHLSETAALELYEATHDCPWNSPSAG